MKEFKLESGKLYCSLDLETHPGILVGTWYGFPGNENIKNSLWESYLMLEKHYTLRKVIYDLRKSEGAWSSLLPWIWGELIPSFRKIGKIPTAVISSESIFSQIALQKLEKNEEIIMKDLFTSCDSMHEALEWVQRKRG